MTLKQSNYRAEVQLRGFTLIEVMLSAVIISIIFLGIQSAMLLAARAAPDRTNGSSAAVRVGQATDQLAADLSCATSITTSTATTIEFIVPDRNGDGSPETIRYSWTGTSRDPLLRTVNGSTAATIAPNITTFRLTYDKRSQAASATSTESGEVLLSSNDGVLFLNLNDQDIDSNSWIGQYFKPTLPSGATQWRVTRVKIRARSHGATPGLTRVQMRATSGGYPTTVLEEVTMLESSLSTSYTWQEFAFTGAASRPAGSAMCLVLQWSSDADSCDVQYQYLLASVPNAYLVSTVTGGNSWSAPLTQSLVYYIYGTYSTPNASTSNYWLTRVRCELCSGSDSLARVSTSIRLLNEPQVSGP